jgi:transcriptional regulator with XRE-family HTH domain
MLIREQLGGVLRDIRKELGLTLSDVRDGAAISPAHLSELERGLTEPSSEVIRTIADFYQVSQADVFREASTRMAASDSVHNIRAKRNVEQLLFGEGYVIAGAESDLVQSEMPDLRNVMPVVPDHIPDDLFTDEKSDSTSNRSQ